MSLSAMSWLHSQSNQGGSGTLFGLAHDERYRRIPSSLLQTHGVTPSVGSASVFESGNVESLQMLFGPPSSWFSLPDYTGGLQQIGNPQGSGSTREVNVPSNLHATSALLVGTHRGGNWEARISLRQQLLDEWVQTIDDQLSGSQASRSGEPVMTWEMFPRNVSHLHEDRMYLRIRQNIDIEIDWWPDYEAWLQYHLRLYINGAGNVRGHVARWEYWVESGAKASSISDRLEPKVVAGMETINDQLTEMLSDFDSHTFSDLYYLPGNQTLGALSGLDGFDMGGGVTVVTEGAPDMSGMTTDDVTVVLELPFGL